MTFQEIFVVIAVVTSLVLFILRIRTKAKSSKGCCGSGGCKGGCSTNSSCRSS